ncbi:MAG: HEPN domain-containing protein [Candidatus Korarchaeota archaeon]|nr:HEPN domain-containing protein [Candidatus Korarchaeota archaeon]
MPEFEFLRKNADSFYRNARHLLEQGEYNLAAFNLEQSMQLMLKYLLASRLGEFPRTHSLRRLFREVKDLCPELWRFYEGNASVVGNMESAYIASRYYPMDFQDVEVRDMLSAYEEFLEVMKRCLKNP